MDNNKYIVADSYKNFKQVGEPKEINGKMRIKVIYSCDRCCGTGIYGRLGTCFKCNGAGKLADWVRIYTEEEKAKYDKQQNKATEKREAEKQIYFNEKHEKWYERNGFNKDKITFMVCGGDTYKIKDQLKELGFKFNPIVKWHRATADVELPEGYKLVAIKAEDCYEWNGRDMIEKDSAVSYIKEIENKFSTIKKPDQQYAHTGYVGKVGERLRKVTATFLGEKEIVGNFGSCMLYKFDIEGKLVTWFTESCVFAQVGDKVTFSGTVKEHKNYNGVQQTVVNRCIIK